MLAGYKPGDIINLGMSMAAVMVLMPRMVKILMEGLMPVSESARTWLNKRFGEREIYIGLDAASIRLSSGYFDSLNFSTYHCFISRYFTRKPSTTFW